VIETERRERERGNKKGGSGETRPERGREERQERSREGGRHKSDQMNTTDFEVGEALTHTYIHAYTHKHTHTYTHACIHAYTHTHTHAYIWK
jgi:hypothetical protein